MNKNFKLILALGIACVLYFTTFGLSVNRAREESKPVPCEEDMPCWDCNTMGNKVCGVPRTLADGCVLEGETYAEGARFTHGYCPVNGQNWPWSRGECLTGDCPNTPVTLPPSTEE